MRAPHGLTVSPRVPCVHCVPLGPRDGPRIADELAGEPAGDVGGQELGGLGHLGDDRGLGRRSRPRVVVRLERQEDDEAEQHREAGREDAENPCSAVAVAEVAAHRGRPAHQQHGGHRRRREGDDGEQPPEEVHRRPGAVVRAMGEVCGLPRLSVSPSARNAAHHGRGRQSQLFESWLRSASPTRSCVRPVAGGASGAVGSTAVSGQLQPGLHDGVGVQRHRLDALRRRSHSAKSGWSDGPCPQMPTYLPRVACRP